MQLQTKKNQVQEAVKSVISIVNLADQVFRKTQCDNFFKQSFAQIEQKLFIVRSKLATATKSLEKINIRRKLIFEVKIQTKLYNIAQNNASEQSILLQWILQQFSLIELELNSAEMTKNDSTQRNCKLQRSLKRNCIDDHNEESASKRRRQDDKDFMLSKSKSRIFIISEIFSTQQSKRSSKFYINSNILASDFYPQRVFCALRSLNTKSDSARSVVILNDNKQITKNRRLKNKDFDGALNSRVLRQSTRLKRPPDRFQWGSKDLNDRWWPACWKRSKKTQVEESKIEPQVQKQFTGQQGWKPWGLYVLSSGYKKSDKTEGKKPDWKIENRTSGRKSVHRTRLKVSRTVRPHFESYKPESTKPKM